MGQLIPSEGLRGMRAKDKTVELDSIAFQIQIRIGYPGCPILVDYRRHIAHLGSARRFCGSHRFLVEGQIEGGTRGGGNDARNKQGMHVSLSQTHSTYWAYIFLV